MFAMVGLVAVVLVIAGVGSLLLTRNASAQPGPATAHVRSQLPDPVQARRGIPPDADRHQGDAQARERRHHPDQPPRHHHRLDPPVRHQPETTSTSPPSRTARPSRVASATSSTRSRRSRSPSRRSTRLDKRRPRHPLRGHVRRAPHPRRREPRPELGLLHPRRRRRARRRRADRLADEPAHGPPARRGHRGDGPHRRRRPREPRPGPQARLPRVRLARRVHQRHGPTTR